MPPTDHGPAGPSESAGHGRHAGAAEDDALAVADTTRVVLRPIASGLPLGFFAFGLGSVLLTALQLGWVPIAQSHPLVLLVLVFVVPLEVVGGLAAFPARDAGAATGLLTLGAAWAGTATLMAQGAPGARSPVLAVFLLSVVPFMLVLSAASMQGKPLFGLLLFFGAVRYALTGCYDATGHHALQTVSGWVGVVLAAFALYGGLALLLEEGTQRTVLPLGRRGRARSSLEGGLADQLCHAEQEAGVRRQL
jgi:succinate-acetate transporter protein